MWADAGGKLLHKLSMFLIKCNTKIIIMVQNEGQDTCRRSQKKRKARGTIQNAKHFRRRNNAQVTHDYHQVRLYNTTKK